MVHISTVSQDDALKEEKFTYPPPGTTTTLILDFKTSST